MVATLADAASNAGKNNVAFLSHFILGDLEKCLDVLIESGRLPEAAFFARTYLPSQISKVLVRVFFFVELFFFVKSKVSSDFFYKIDCTEKNIIALIS